MITIEHPEDIVSASHLGKNPGKYLDRAHKSPVFIVRNNNLDSVLVGIHTWGKIQEMLEDYLDLLQAKASFSEPRADEGKTMEDLFTEAKNG